MPPASTQGVVPEAMVWVPRMMALREEAQTLLMVVQIVEGGRPALMAHWRAGFWPRLGRMMLGRVMCFGSEVLDSGKMGGGNGLGGYRTLRR